MTVVMLQGVVILLSIYELLCMDGCVTLKVKHRLRDLGEAINSL